MTKEEITKAVENLKKIRKQFNKYEFTHSIDLAIDALEERPTGGQVVPDTLQGWKYQEAENDSSK